jgi:hypothetical protein
MTAKPITLACRACGQETVLKRIPEYDGFRKTGERLECALCGHRYESEADVPARGASRPALFSEDERPARPVLFRDEERGRFCRTCMHYVVNPFTQRCDKHRRLVEATDSCGDFDARPDAEP